MENFLIDDKFYRSISEYIYEKDLTLEEVNLLPDNYEIIAEKTELEPIFQLNSEDLTEILFEYYEERTTEEANEFRKIQSALTQSIDFNKLNELLPKLYYGIEKDLIIKKSDLIKQFKQ